MNKLFVFLLVAVSVLISFGLSSRVTANKNQSAVVNPTATPTRQFSAEIEKIELDRKEVLIPCPLLPENYRSSLPSACIDYNGLISVETVVKNPKNKALTYQYTVSGGRILGQGEKVFWDLEGTRPGTYTITVAIDEGRGFSDKMQTQTITVRECGCPDFCSCPTLDVTRSGNVRAGETVEFTADVKGGTAGDITYNWTVSKGEIIEGQGTPQIKVKTTSEMTGTIKATVEIGAVGLCAECPRTASETGTIIK
jgi:hypothetical protein